METFYSQELLQKCQDIKGRFLLVFSTPDKCPVLWAVSLLWSRGQLFPCADTGIHFLHIHWLLLPHLLFDWELALDALERRRCLERANLGC